jgi:hypothetical protein
MKQTTNTQNETINKRRKAILQGNQYKRSTGGKPVNPYRNIDKLIKGHRLSLNEII